MRNVIAIPSVEGSLPIELRHLRVAAYCRVSTEQEEQTSSIELQKRYYTQLISGNPNWENVGIFSERATGLNLKERTEFHRMISKCRKKKVDLIFTKSISRFGRNTLDMLQSLQELRSLGVDVYFEQENMRLSGQQIQVLLAAYCAFAQTESEEMSRNIKWGIKRGFENGTSGYAEFVCFGYKRGNNGRLAIDEADAIIVRQIFTMRANGSSLGSIAGWLFERQILSPTGKSQWSRETISKLLRNEKYIGDALLQKTYVTDCISKQVKKNTGDRTMYYVENNHPAIISRELFQRVQEELTRRASKRKVMQKTGKTEQGKYSAKYALSELLVCGECGTPYKRCTWARNGKKRIVWRCISRLEFGRKYCHTSPTLDEEKLYRVILEAINDFAQIEQEVKADILEWTNLAWSGRETDGASLLTLRQRLNDITFQQAILLDQVLAAMDDSALNAQLKTLMDEKQAVQEQIKALEQDEIHSASQASRMEELKEWLAKLQVNGQYDDEQVRMAIEKITVLDPETIRIQFKYPGLEVDKSLNR